MHRPSACSPTPPPPQDIQAHPWFMQGLEPGALNFNDAIVQVCGATAGSGTTCPPPSLMRSRLSPALLQAGRHCAAGQRSFPRRTTCLSVALQPTVLLQESLANQPTPEMLAEVHSIVQEALNELPDAEGHPQQPPQMQGQGKFAGFLARGIVLVQLACCPVRNPGSMRHQLPGLMAPAPFMKRPAGDMLVSEELSGYLTSGALGPHKAENMVAARGP